MAVVPPVSSDYHGGVDIGMLTELGRERGPDLQLKIDATVLAFQAAGTLDIIKQDSSITEVLNVVSYLVYDGSVGGGGGGVRNFASMVDTNNSVGAAVGGVDPASGFYNNAATAVTAANDPFLNTAAPAAAPTVPFINLNTFAPAAQAADAFIPVSILRRTSAQDAANGNINKVINDANVANFRKVDANGANAITLLSDCVKQMINILIKTREIFGPKGWTALFQQVKGGGRTGKTHAKRTHRRHRRRYSSKQY
jgi:hypothetical protein